MALQLPTNKGDMIANVNVLREWEPLLTAISSSMCFLLSLPHLPSSFPTASAAIRRVFSLGDLLATAVR